MKTPGIDLTDLDRFQRGEHHEMFRRLRAEEPVAWHELPGAKGFWNVVTHADVTQVNRDSRAVLVREGGRERLLQHRTNSGLTTAGDLLGVMLLVHRPAQAHPLPQAGQQGLHPADDRPAGAVPPPTGRR